MKKIILYVLTIFCLLGLLYKTFNPNDEFNNLDFLEYMSDCPQIEIENVVSEITTDWGSLNFLRSLFNTIITVFNFVMKFIGTMFNAVSAIVYGISYFFGLSDANFQPDTSSGGGFGPGWRGGR